MSQTFCEIMKAAIAKAAESLKMVEIARRAGVSRDALYKVMDPELYTQVSLERAMQIASLPECELGEDELAILRISWWRERADKAGVGGTSWKILEDLMKEIERSGKGRPQGPLLNAARDALNQEP